MRHSTIIAGAPLPGEDGFYRALIERADNLVAADFGAVLCREAGRVPDVLVGDFDSIPAEVLSWAESGGSTIVTARADKDVTDLDLSLFAVRDADIALVTVSAAWSGRLDHTLASLGSIARVPELQIDLIDPGFSGWVLRPESRPSVTIGPAGAICSLFAVIADAVVSTCGMRYELTQGLLRPLSSHGLSNVIVADSAEVTVHAGVLVVLSNPLGDGVMACHTDGGL